MGQVAHTLPEGEPVLGVTLLAGELYLLRDKERDQVEVYDVITYRLRRCLTVPDAIGFIDMTSCEHNRCVYISNGISDRVHRLDVEGAVTHWDVGERPMGLSVNAAHNLLVTCTCSVLHKIKEFSSRGALLREVTFRDEAIIVWHAMQTRCGRFIVCHDDPGDRVPHVCAMSDDGRLIVHSHDGQPPGSDTGQYRPGLMTMLENICSHLAVDDNESVFVADVFNRRVTLLSPTLRYVRQVVSRDQLKGLPGRLCFESQRQRLYVADNEYNNRWYTAGRVLVFRV